MIFEPIFQALNNSEVRYLVVGGLAVVLHGRLRTTGDVDLIIGLQEENCRKGIQALVDLGFRSRAAVDPLLFADRTVREDWITTKGLTVFSLYGTTELPLEVDIFVREPFDFEQLWTKRKDALIGNTIVHVVDVDSLIALKEASGRIQDIQDIRDLRTIHDE